MTDTCNEAFPCDECTSAMARRAGLCDKDIGGQKRCTLADEHDGGCRWESPDRMPTDELPRWRRFEPASGGGSHSQTEWDDFKASLTDDQMEFLAHKARWEQMTLTKVARIYGVPPTPSDWRRS